MRTLPIAITLAAAVGLACGGSPGPDEAGDRRRISTRYSAATGLLEELKVETPGGAIEARAEMHGTSFRRVEIDTNGDGQPDRWEYYAEPGRGGAAGTGNAIVRAEQATRFDGIVSRWEHYESGVLVRADEDVNGDGALDKWERYEDGALASVDLDLNGAGRPDRRLIFRPGGATEVVDLR